MPTQDSVITFHQGKQNRDNDPRVIKNGEYIKLVNGRIARSEGDGVGSIENTLGNELVSTFVDVNAVVLGSVRDIAEDKIYYFIKGSEEDAVYEFNEVTGRSMPLLRDDKGILNFSVDHLITGVNIIGQSDPGDDEEENPDNIISQKLLLWTDNFNPPRKININRIKADLGGGLGGFTESEISLEKAPPLFSPQAEEVYLDIDTAVAPESEINVIINQEDIDKPLARKRELAQIAIESFNDEENLKEKFPRFAYRYRYEDNEYSAFSPFSKPMFRPGRFNFDRDTGSITGMENQMKAIDISFNTGPREVIEVDLLYKDTMSNTVYVVESYNKADRGWGNDVDLSSLQEIEKPIRFSTQKLYRALPDSQLLRVYDNVPLKAQAMEIVDNRVMFANYTDQYDLIDVRKIYDAEGNLTDTIEEEIVVDLNARISKPEEVGQSGDSIQPGVGERTLKSDRDYELGIVYLDNLGRQTPVLTSQNNSVNIPIDRANKINRLSLEINSKAPEFATHYRAFIKNTRSAPHYNLIPLETQLQPDDDAFRWFRLPDTDQEKVKIGDHLVLKVNMGTFAYLEGEGLKRIQVRVEDAGIKGRNFLEVNAPRIGKIINDDEDEVNFGEVLDEGREITVQRPGFWIKIKNIAEIPPDEEFPATASESISRANAARNSNFRPIKNLPETIDLWKDMTYYYVGNNSTSDTSFDEESVVFSTGTEPDPDLNGQTRSDWTPGVNPWNVATDPENAALIPGGNPVASGTTNAGPMRVEVEILPNNEFRTRFYVSRSVASPAVRVQTLQDREITTGAHDIMNGVTITFDDTLTYNVGDRWVTTYRTSHNYMWRVYEPGQGSPNNATKTNRNARRSHIMLYGPGVFENGINGNSMIQFGIEDGLRGRLDGDPIVLQSERNQYFTENTFYDNFEEWMFEEGYYTSGGVNKFAGTARDGEGFGIHQMGFYRGIPVTPNNDAPLPSLVTMLASGGVAGTVAGGGTVSALSVLFLGSGKIGAALTYLNPWFALGGLAVSALLKAFVGGKTTEDAWRLASAASGDLVDHTDNEAMPLYAFVQSGTENEEGNSAKADIRQKAEFQFFQGNGSSEDEITLMNLAFETIPEESNLDVFYEIGETFPCLNGVHFGNEMSNSQKITYLDANGDETFDAFSTEVVPVEGKMGSFTVVERPNTETKKVSSITVNLEYQNCFAWNNGIEAMAIRDEIQSPALDAGAKASIVTQDYEESNNFGNIIFSERFDNQSGINGLNEFSSTAAALRQNIKEMDEADGSIQKLFSKDTNLIVFQEDKVSQIQVNKNVLFNADGSSNVSSSRQVLGQTQSFAGEFGISKNPESFAVYGNRIYFSDANRGVICRIGGSGIEEISNFGMRDFFREELGYRYEDDAGIGRAPIVIGQYDDYHDQYLVSIREPINDPSLERINKPLLISKQAFLSRTDACRYPEEDLQFTQVYEFYTANEPQGFQVGDLIYYDEARTKIFNGDNNWFVWYDHVNELDVTGENAIEVTMGEDVFTQTFAGAEFPDQPLIEQRVSVVNLLDGQVYQGEVINVTPSQKEQFIDTFNADGDPITISAGFIDTFNVVVRYDEGQNLTTDLLLAGDYEINTTYKYVINIDNFGVVRARVNCVGVLPANYDAVRISIRSYTSPQEACGKGVVTRMVFHDGNDVTPDVDDAIYDTPYGSDEFIDGDYSKGRTQKRGWYKMFDGDGFEDYVINIIQGKVEKKIPCSQIEAGRTRVLTSEFPIQRRMSELERRLATRICAVLPAEENFHDGVNTFPVLGDTLYEDNFTDSPLPMGYYAVDGGFYARVNEEGTITFISDCSIKLCYDDVVRARVMKRQDRDINNWRFCGVGDLGLAYPTVSATTATLGATPGEIIFNGSVDTLGDYPTADIPINAAWYWLNVPDDADGNPMFIPTERELLNDGRRIAGMEMVERTGSVPDVTRAGFPSFANVFHMFVVEIGNVFITTDVLLAETLRTTLPTTNIVASADANPMTPAIIDVPLGNDVTLSSSFNAEPGDIPTGYQWLLNGAAIAGETNANLDITDFEAADAGNYSLQTFFSGGLTIVSNVLNLQYVIVFRTTAFARSAPTTNAPGDMTSDHTLTVTGVPGSTYNISVDHGTISPVSGTIPGTASPTNLSDTFTHTWTLPINTADGTDTSLGNGEQDRTATIAVTGATVEHTGDDDVVVTHDDAPAPVDVDPNYGPTNPAVTTTAVSVASETANCAGVNWAPGLGTRTANFNQSRTCPTVIVYNDGQSHDQKTCNDAGGNTPLWGGVYNDCSDADGTAAFGNTLSFNPQPITQANGAGTQGFSRLITVTGTTTSSPGFPQTEDAYGSDVNMDGDTVDTVDQGDTEYTTSPNIGSHTVPGTTPMVTGNLTPTLTLTRNNNLTFTGGATAANVTITGADTGDNVTGGSVAYSFTATATPAAGFQIGTAGDGVAVSFTVSGTTATTPVNQTETLNITGVVSPVVTVVDGTITLNNPGAGTCVAGAFGADCICSYPVTGTGGTAGGSQFLGGVAPGTDITAPLVNVGMNFNQNANCAPAPTLTFTAICTDPSSTTGFSICNDGGTNSTSSIGGGNVTCTGMLFGTVVPAIGDTFTC